MLSLFILVLFGVGVAFFATQNTQVASMFLGSYSLVNVPLYMIVIGAMLFGILVSWIISLFGFISTSLTLRGKDGRIRDAQARIQALEERNKELEEENSSLREHEHHEPVVTETQPRPSPFVRFRQRFS